MPEKTRDENFIDMNTNIQKRRQVFLTKLPELIGAHTRSRNIKFIKELEDFFGYSMEDGLKEDLQEHYRLEFSTDRVLLMKKPPKKKKKHF